MDLYLTRLRGELAARLIFFSLSPSHHMKLWSWHSQLEFFQILSYGSSTQLRACTWLPFWVSSTSFSICGSFLRLSCTARAVQSADGPWLAYFSPAFLVASSARIVDLAISWVRSDLTFQTTQVHRSVHLYLWCLNVHSQVLKTVRRISQWTTWTLGSWLDMNHANHIFNLRGRQSYLFVFKILL